MRKYLVHLINDRLVLVIANGCAVIREAGHRTRRLKEARKYLVHLINDCLVLVIAMGV